MRHPYTPIFRDLLDSSLWASASPAIRCAWLAFLLDADPEGCIPTSIPGLARRANIPVEDARAAVALLEAPDPDSRTPDFEGRRIAKVTGGWQILNFVTYRERAKLEAEKARKRRWANANPKRPANDNDAPPDGGDASSERPPTSNIDATSETLDAPKPKSKPKSKPGREDPDPPLPLLEEPSEPEGGPDLYDHETRTVLAHPAQKLAVQAFAREAGVFDAPSRPLTLHSLPDDWQPSDELRASAAILGVKLDHWIAKLRLIPIGGAAGVIASKLDAYVEGMLGQWKVWQDTNAAKDAQRAASGGPGSRFGKGGGALVGPEPGERHRAFAREHGLSLDDAVKACVEKNYTRESYGPKDLATALERQLLAMMRAREASA